VLLKSRKLSTKDSFETFPAWSPDGRYLYYCSAQSMPLDSFKRIRYSLLRVVFNSETMSFGQVDTLISSRKTGQSISFPRISPDGKYLLFCMSDYGNFSIWHKESDLYLLNLSNLQISKPDINSGESESYHQWSSNGKWIVFSSRRNNGLFTRIYFSHFDENGIAQKPFILPQNNPDYYQNFMKSYNIPELIISKIRTDPKTFSEIAKSNPLPIETKIIE
jgi:dipeptidyl aminopeptidase/acylaminoacyl peptidase